MTYNNLILYASGYLYSSYTKLSHTVNLTYGRGTCYTGDLFAAAAAAADPVAPRASTTQQTKQLPGQQPLLEYGRLPSNLEHKCLHLCLLQCCKQFKPFSLRAVLCCRIFKSFQE